MNTCGSIKPDLKMQTVLSYFSMNIQYQSTLMQESFYFALAVLCFWLLELHWKQNLFKHLSIQGELVEYPWLYITHIQYVR